METTRPQRPPFSSIAVSERPEKRVKIRHFILVTLTQQCSTKLCSFKGFKSSCLFKKVREANANCSRNLSSAENLWESHDYNNTSNLQAIVFFY